MSKNYTSPFASNFNSAIKRGTPCSVAINSIAKSKSKTPKFIFESLFKAGLCSRQKFNGQWIYWTNQPSKKSNATTRNDCQNNMWQNFIDWCICSGFCTPEQLSNHSGSQKEFMSFCKKFFAKQFSPATATKKRKTSRKTSRKTTATKARKRPSTSKKRSTSFSSKKRSTKRKSTSPKSNRKSSYKFPTAKKSTSTRRYRKVA